MNKQSIENPVKNACPVLESVSQEVVQIGYNDDLTTYVCYLGVIMWLINCF